MHTTVKPLSPRIDKLGVFASLACAVHCLALPFLLTVWPLIGVRILDQHAIEKGILVFTVILALFSLCWGTRVHRKKHVLFFLVFAIMCFLVAHSVIHEEHFIFMALGGVSLAVGHFLNLRLCKSCHQCDHH